MPIRILLVAALPLLTHLAVVWRRSDLQCAGLVCAGAAMFFPSLRAGRLRAWLGLGLAAAADWWLLHADGGAYVLYLPSLLIPCLALSAFAPTLLPGRMPLITRVAEAADGPLSTAQRSYTRYVTWLWTVALALILAVTLGLLLFRSVHAWSVFANGLSYLLLGALFVGEYAVRRLRFPEKAPLNLRAFVRSVSSYRPH